MAASTSDARSGPTGRWALAADTPTVRAALGGARVLRHLVLLGTVASTQDELLQRADPRSGAAVAGTVVIAERQTAGRGRGGRAWDDDTRPGASLALSLLLDPFADPRRTGLVPLALGVGIQGAIATLDVAAVRRVGLKWPNDVLVRDAQDVPRKLAGLLVERTLIAGRDVLAAGIGINVDQGHLDHSVGELAQRTSVAELLASASSDPATPPSVDLPAALLGAVIVQLDAALVLLDEQPDMLLERYRHGSDTIGRTVRVEREGSAPLVGTAETVDAQGRLVVRTRAGHEVVVAGTVRDAGT
jgi:BirA family transcriptional regulator, biotin operon repressor / biotin---[acetyl-CoA-carboxylase] ligase